LYDLQSPALTGVMSLLTQLGSIHVLAALSLLTAVLLRRFWRREALFFGLSVAGAGGLILFVKGFLARPRPDLFEPLMHTGSFSFPSGHSLGTAAFLSSLALVWWRRSPRYRLPFAVFAALAALGVGLSRVYLQVHYPSDVLAGWLLGLAWVLGLNAWFGRAAAGRPD
jgi:undecaprenyl-diphosphatase